LGVEAMREIEDRIDDVEAEPESTELPSSRATIAPARAPLGERVSAWMTPTRAAVISLVAILIVLAGDMLTGVEVTFALLYKFPLALGTWFVGRRFGYFLSCVATLGAYLTMRFDPDTFVSPAATAWNVGGALITFLLVTYLVDLLHAHVERQKREKALAIGQLRHAERLNVIGKLAAGVAHELGTPLNIITANAELMVERPKSVASTREHARAILAQAERMTTILRQLLDFGRRGASEVALADLNRITRRSAELTLPLFRKSGCTVELALSDAPLPVRVNAPEIEQVVTNLLVNAAQAMRGHPGPIRLETRLDEGRPDFARVEITDTGRGIEAKDLPHVFDPFFTTKDVGEGSGLGLSVSYGIVADHRGRIEVESTPGKGSRFTVLLRLAQ
jgi:signal transduction histidine kinase